MLVEQVFPVSVLAEPLILSRTLAVRVNDISALVLQEEPLSLIIQSLLVDVVHLLPLNQGDNVQISSQLAFASLKELATLLG